MTATSALLAPGDLVEIETATGLAYLQVTHRHPSYPEVVRALTGALAARPADLEALARSPTRFLAMFPLSEAMAEGTIRARRIGAAAVPPEARAFPVFKMAIHGKPAGVRGDIAYWWFWDGETLTYDVDPPPSAKAYPAREVLTANELVRRLMEIGQSEAPASSMM